MEAWTIRLAQIEGWVWGRPLLVLLVGTGLYLTVLLRGLQFRALPLAFRLMFRREDAEGDVSHFAALMTALAATVGNGNIVGVAGAIAIGGPGAIFWMWITGLVGMATKYSEAVLAVRYRVSGPRGMQGGPMYYLSHGARMPLLGTAFAVFTMFSAFGIGNMVQVNSAADNFKQAFGIAPAITGIVLALLTGAVILGGIRWIGRFSSVLVPAMILGYCGAGLVVLIVNFEAIPAAFASIFHYAFSPIAAAGGFAGAAVKTAIMKGVSRGVFSNESGLGSAPIAAAAARTKDPATQALVSMTQTFIDTIVVCTMTALVILTSGVWQTTSDDSVLTGLGFSSVLGNAGLITVAIASFVFAYSTVIGWCYYGEKSVEYLFGTQSVLPYRVLFVLVVLLGGLASKESDWTKIVWSASGIMNGLMAAPNLLGLLILSRVIRQETDQFFAGRKSEGTGAVND